MEWNERFDKWRAEYDVMTFADHVKFYELIATTFPNQMQFDAFWAKMFFKEILQGLDYINVLEIGGWRGELAQIILPNVQKIRAWDNAEICDDAVKGTVCEDDRYMPMLLDGFVWDMPSDSFNGYNVLVMSHVVEHMKAANLEKLISIMEDVKFIYIDAPIHARTSDVNWKGYIGTHILEIGWHDVMKMMRKFGFEDFYQVKTIHFFRR